MNNLIIFDFSVFEGKRKQKIISSTLSKQMKSDYIPQDGTLGLANNSGQSGFGKRTIIEERYLLRKLAFKTPNYNVYEGVDIKASKFVTVYLKPANVEFNFSKKIKEELRSKISPQILWSGTFKLDKNVFGVQIHQKFGPSLRSMFNYIQTSVSDRDLLLLLYQLIRLIEKYGSVGYIFRELDMRTIIFDSKPQKNDLFLFNVFTLKKKGDETQPISSRFCSRGAHLGLKSCIKDDLQSICYILINIHSNDEFLREIPQQQYQSAKSHIDLSSFSRPLPSLFIDFYSYVISLNYNDQVNYFKWRNLIYRTVGKQAVLKPYQWMLAKGNLRSQYSVKSIDEIEDQLKPQDRILSEKMEVMNFGKLLKK